MRAVITVGDAVEVGAAREGSRETDPLSLRLRQEMEILMEISKAHRRTEPTGTDLI